MPSSSSSTAATCRSGARASSIAGLTPADLTSSLHYILPAPLDANFLLHLGPFADVIPIPVPIIQNVASIGDVFLTLGLAFFLFAAVVRVPQELDEEQLEAIRLRARAIWPSAAARQRAGDPGRRDRPVTGADRGRRARAAARPGQRRARAGLAVARRASNPTRRAAGTITIPIPTPVPRGGRARPPAPVRPARAQRLVLGALGRPAHLAVRRPAQSARAGRGRRDLDGLRARHGARVLRGHAPEPAAQPDRGHVRRPLGPQGGDGRQRHPAGGARPDPADRGGHQHRPGLPADLPRHDHLGLLPAGAGRPPAADRPRGGPAQRELGDVGRRDDRRRRSATRWPASSSPARHRRAARLLGRQRRPTSPRRP